ncbi:MAG TPA: NAD(P)-binding domain-containing protein [Actinoplanes sp.]|jgi:hypothetical protein|nr:NAD(P)-binding domain-containing protein [Actinoplanes sp.]
MSHNDKLTIGTIGAGRVAQTIARLALAAGHEVILSNSRGPESLTDLADHLGAGASTGTVNDAARADITVLAVGWDQVPAALGNGVDLSGRIDAPPAAVWPWLVQMGSGRGGAYTYDWIENLFGLNMHSADRILAEFQHLAVGDVLPLGPQGPGMRVQICDPGRTLAFRSTEADWVWTFRLAGRAHGTRLVSRNRSAVTYSGPARWLTNRLVVEPGSLIMERRMLLGIKERAESVLV